MGVYRQQTADNAPGRELLNRSAHIRLTSRLTAVFMLMKSSAEPQMTFLRTGQSAMIRAYIADIVA